VSILAAQQPQRGHSTVLIITTCLAQ
jgi:hypothetical protein